MTTPNVDEALEAARCAQINFNNLVRVTPQLAQHPFYRIARHQLDCAVEQLGGEPAGELGA